MPLYRQYSLRLRLQYGPGRPDVNSTRPHHETADGRRIYDDSDEAPTLVLLTGEEVGIDVAMLLAAGSIAPYDGPLSEPVSAETLGLPTRAARAAAAPVRLGRRRRG